MLDMNGSRCVFHVNMTLLPQLENGRGTKEKLATTGTVVKKKSHTLIKKLLFFVEAESLLQCSQNPITGPSSSTFSHIAYCVFRKYVNVIFSCTPRSS
jgi:hypothetical protein